MTKRLKDEYLEVVRAAHSAAHALRLLGLRPAGGNYIALRDRIEKYKLDTSHWLGKGHWKGRHNPHVPKIALERILIKPSKYRGSTTLLRHRLVASGLLKEECTMCHIATWQERPLTLHLDHVNGDRFDNRIENLGFFVRTATAKQTPTVGETRAGSVSYKALLRSPEVFPAACVERQQDRD